MQTLHPSTWHIIFSKVLEIQLKKNYANCNLSITLHPMSFDNFHYQNFLYIRIAAEMLILEQYF